MATVTRYIYSHYDPEDRERLEKETGQISSYSADDEPHHEDDGDPWQTEDTFGARRRLAAAPRFVPATISYDEVNSMLGGIPREVLQPLVEKPKSDVSSWYRSLTRSNGLGEVGRSASVSQEKSSTAPASNSTSPKISLAYPRPDKSSWFIARALRSQPSSASPTPPPTLADILAREPPASSSQEAFKPPVFLALGPSNRGWGMLQQKGWSEGEGLGANIARRVIRPAVPHTSPTSSMTVKAERAVVKTEQQEVQLDPDGDISEMRQVEVVDLTMSDSEEEIDVDEEDSDLAIESATSISSVSASSTSHSTPLLTPIPTILKSDRLGIGLKAKTEGPYKASKKRITHNQAALAAHIRTNEEMRRLKAKVGRGTRGFARLAKADSEQRRQLLASLNEG